jgi:hypothetical protein
MNGEFDYDLTRNQWETLKSLRAPKHERLGLNRFVLDELTALGLVATLDNSPVITATGRKALIRGSSTLWDVAV